VDAQVGLVADLLGDEEVAGFEDAQHFARVVASVPVDDKFKGVIREGQMLVVYCIDGRAQRLEEMARHGEVRRITLGGIHLWYWLALEHLAQIAESLGYEVVSIDPFRTRMATATQSSLSEEVVVLRWPGSEVSLHYHKKEVEMSRNSQYDSNLFGEKLAESGEEYMEDVEEEEEVSSTSRKKQDTRYGQIVEYIFFQHYKEGNEKVDFERERTMSFLSKQKAGMISWELYKLSRIMPYVLIGFRGM